MNHRKRRLARAIVVAAATTCTVLAAYVLSYAFGCEVNSHPHVKIRTYRSPVQVVLYMPAAQVESALLGIPIELRDSWPPSEPPTPLGV